MQNENSQSTKRIATLIVIVLVLVGTVWAVLAYIYSFQKITVSYITSDVAKLEVYKGVDQNGNVRATGQAIQTFQSGHTYKVKKGVYILRASGPKLDSADTVVRLGGTALTQKIDPDYSGTYLESQLVNQEPNIISVLKASNPKLASLYKINPGTLYHHGEWYGTTLSYTGTDSLSRDTLRAVAHYTNGAWVVATNPPEISLSAKDYPSVPHSVLSAVDAVDIGLPVIVSP